MDGRGCRRGCRNAYADVFGKRGDFGGFRRDRLRGDEIFRQKRRRVSARADNGRRRSADPRRRQRYRRRNNQTADNSGHRPCGDNLPRRRRHGKGQYVGHGISPTDLRQYHGIRTVGNYCGRRLFRFGPRGHAGDGRVDGCDGIFRQRQL